MRMQVLEDPKRVTSDWLPTVHPCDFSKVGSYCLFDFGSAHKLGIDQTSEGIPSIARQHKKKCPPLLQCSTPFKREEMLIHLIAAI